MREKELRLALVCYGGISLAVYMHGITREIWKLLAASRARLAGEEPPSGDSERVYFELLETLAEGGFELRVLADIIAGASAGGINGIFLGQAIATGQSLDPLVDLWLEKADIDELLDEEARPRSRLSKFYAEPMLYFLRKTRSVDVMEEVEAGAREEVAEKLSRFVRSRWFKPPFSGERFCGYLLDAFAAMGAGPATPPLIPDGQPVDLFVTVTDFFGAEQRLRLHSPASVEETEHRKVISFRDEGRNPARRYLADPAALTFAARATASFPGAFPPFQAVEIERELQRRDQAWPDEAAFLARVMPARTAEDRAEVPLLDGSILNNAPFRPALASLRDRPARREVDRRFVYIDPKPGIRSIGGHRSRDGGPPGFFTTIIQSLSDIPREQPIRDDLDALDSRSRRIRRLQHVLRSITASTEQQIETALGERTLSGRPSAAKLEALRASANAEAVSRSGYGYPGYAHLKLAEIVDSLIDLISDVGDHRDGAKRDTIRRAIWLWVRQEGYDAVTLTTKPKLAAQDDYVGFLKRFDIGYRIRRLRYAIRQLTSLEASLSGEEAAAAGRARGALFEALAPFVARRSRGYFDGQVLDLAKDLPDAVGETMNAYADALDLVRLDAESDRRISVILRGAGCPPAVRRALLGAWLGFSFYDIATFPILQGEGLGEFDEIKVDRISPDDATSIRSGGAQATLKGIRFNSFGAFFSRAYRENDYLWGRLHGAERLIDIVLSTLSPPDRPNTEAVRQLKRRAFTAILDAEEERLKAIPELIAELRAEVTA